jgi:hypothetical protein
VVEHLDGLILYRYERGICDMKDKLLREYFQTDETYDKKSIYKSNAANKNDVARLDRRMDNINRNMIRIGDMIDILTQSMGYRFKYQNEYPDMELVRKEKENETCICGRQDT